MLCLLVWCGLSLVYGNILSQEEEESSNQTKTMEPFVYETARRVRATSMEYEPSNQLLYVTGSTIATSGSEPNCFLDIFQLGTDDGYHLVQSKIFGLPANRDTCTSLDVVSDGPNTDESRIIIASRSGLLSGEMDRILGGVIDVTVDSRFQDPPTSGNGPALLVGGAFMEHYAHPTSVNQIQDLNGDTSIVVASNIQVPRDTNLRVFNPPDSGTISVCKFRFRSAKDMALMNEPDDLGNGDSMTYTLNMAFNRHFQTEEKEPAMIASVVQIHRVTKVMVTTENDLTEERQQEQNFIIMAGTTTGYGTAFGADAKGTGDLDGFVTKLDSDTGLILVSNDDESHNQHYADHSKRIISQPGNNDAISNLCVGIDNESIYVVGTTEGIMESGVKFDADQDNGEKITSGYVMKLDVDSLKPLWVRQIVPTIFPAVDDVIPDGKKPTEAEMSSSSCAITSDGGTLYVLSSLTTMASPGAGVLALSSFNSTTGTTNFMKVLGVEPTERMTAVDVSTDRFGNAIVLGNTLDDVTGVSSEPATGGFSFNPVVDDIRYFLVSVDRYTGETVPSFTPPSQKSGTNNTQRGLQPLEMVAILASALVIALGLIFVTRGILMAHRSGSGSPELAHVNDSDHGSIVEGALYDGRDLD